MRVHGKQEKNTLVYSLIQQIFVKPNMTFHTASFKFTGLRMRIPWNKTSVMQKSFIQHDKGTMTENIGPSPLVATVSASFQIFKSEALCHLRYADNWNKN